MDAYIGDWDRHADQWRWAEKKSSDGKIYTAVPRDRDQAFFVNEGIISRFASRGWIMPHLQGWTGIYRNINTLMFKGELLDPFFVFDFSRQQWDSITHQFSNALTDDVLARSAAKLPAAVYEKTGSQMLALMKQRRDNLPAASMRYYHFLNKIVDVYGSDKNELFTIKDTLNAGLYVSVNKMEKNGRTGALLFHRTLLPEETGELRIFTLGGQDSVVVSNLRSKIRIRITGSTSESHYVLGETRKSKLLIYDDSTTQFSGRGRARIKYQNQPAALEPALTKRYHVTMPLMAFAFNLDDGLLLGAGIRHTHQGFRKSPYGWMQELKGQVSLSTGALRVRYYGEWNQVLRDAGIRLAVDIKAPDNTTNYFGYGNETVFDKKKTDPSIRFYRIRYNWMSINPEIFWNRNNKLKFGIGPGFQRYALQASENVDRLIEHPSLVGTYDSATVTSNRLHLGFGYSLTLDRRNSVLLPSRGLYLNFGGGAWWGLNSAAKNYLNLHGEFSFYASLNKLGTIVLANRTGGAVTSGDPAFYQLQYLGGHGNLMGFRQYRFAGEEMFFNNIEIRIQVAKMASYLLPGTLGVMGFYDTGRVWEKQDHSQQWHSGTGFGVYFAPAQLAVLQLSLGRTREGWQPDFTLGLRF